MGAITVKELKKFCEEQIKKGNGNKVIMISQDDEGNSYHYLWYSFTEIVDDYYDIDINEDIAKKEDTIILG